jgi:tape measure domain-containing protein
MAQAQIKITADTTQALASINRIEKSLGGLRSSANLATAALGALAGVLSVRALITFSDEITSVRNRLNQLSDSQEEVTAQFKALAGIALEARTPLSQTSDLYFRIAKNADQLGISQREAAEITRSVAKAISASGMSAQEAAGPLLQLGQALQSGRFQGDELRSILEGLPSVAKALADGLGVPIGALKELGSQGRITGQDFVEAMRKARDSIDRDFAKTIPTVAQAFQQLKTASMIAYDQFEQNTKVGQSLARTIQILAGAILIAADSVDEWIPQLKLTAQIIGALAGAAIIGKLITGIIGVAAAVRIAMMTFGGWLGILLKVAAAIGVYIGLEKFADSLDATGEGANFADKALKKLAESQNKYLDALDNSSKAAPAAYDAKLIENQRKALEARNQEFEKALRDQAQAVQLAGLEGSELEKQTRLNSVNNSLIKEIRNERNEIVGYTKGLTEEERRALTILIDQAHYRQVMVGLQRDLATAVAEANRLNIQDLNVREEQAALDSKRLQLARDLTQEEEAQIRAIVRQTQASKERLAIEEQQRLLRGQATPQTREQQIQTATGVISRLDPRLSAEQQFNTDMEALRNTAFESEAQRLQMMERLRREHANRVHEIAKQQTEAELRQSGVTNQGIIDAVRKSQDNIRMMQEGGIRAVMGGIDQMSYIFGQLGTYNKRAFEAAKAFNIANAVMNTYLGATKALAMYPPPFNFIAAAGVVASGLAQVAAIRSQSFSGRQLGGPVMGGQSYIVGENGPELFTPNTTGSITRNQDIGGNGQVNVNFTIVANDTTGFDQLLNSRRGMIQQIISDAMLEKGRRSMV